MVKLPNGQYRMYYQSSRQSPMGMAPPFHVRSAISNDGISFTREGVRIDIYPYDSLSPLRLAGHGTYFISENGTCVGIFSGEFTADSIGPGDLKTGTSSDGLTWGNFQTLYTDWHDPVVLNINGDCFLYATCLLEKRGKAFSSDGIFWQAQPDSIVLQDSSGNRLTEGNSGVGDIGGVLLVTGEVLLYTNWGSPSLDVVVFEMDSQGTGLREMADAGNDGIRIYQNPSAGQIRIAVQGAGSHRESSELKIYDSLEKLVHRQIMHSGKGTLELNLPAGIYMAVLYAGERIYRGKIVRQQGR